MSVWTHVCGVIRIDKIRVLSDEKPYFPFILGKELSYSDSLEKWEMAHEHPEGFMPFGSEGSLQKNVLENPDKRDVCAYIVTVFGDLRDYTSVDRVIDWFREVCAKIELTDMWVRDAVITVHCEDGTTKTYHHGY